MRVKVRSFGPFIKALGHENTLELPEGATIGALLAVLAQRAGELKGHLLGYDERAPSMAVLLNGLNIKLIEGSRTLLKDGDTVSLLPPAAGG